MDYFSSGLKVPYHLFYNTVADSYIRIKEGNVNVSTSPAPLLHQMIPRRSTNLGKDIGGKMVLMDAYLKLETKSDYLLFLHDKQSLHQHNGQQWRRNLFRIAEKENQQKAFDIFSKNPSVGIVASSNAIRNEWDNEQKTDHYTTSTFITILKKRYSIHPPSLQFVAGTMFWVRAALLESFFTKYPPLLIRATLEEGNVMDNLPTCTHAWERLLCWVVTSQGYQIKGI